MNIQALQVFIENHPRLFLAILIWSLIWKGLALWKAAQRDEKNWFIVLLLLNTLGILDIIYYYFVGNKQTDQDRAYDDTSNN